MRKRNLGFVLAALMGAGVVATAPVASADTASTADWATTYGNVNGYGTDERVTVRDIDEDTHELVVTFSNGSVDRYRYSVDAGPVRTPRITDINRDGRDEVLVFTSTGANTSRLRILTLAPGIGWISVKGSANRVFHLWEGGGVAAASRYRCEADLLAKVSAEIDSNGRTYSGTVNWYLLEDTKVDWLYTERFSGVSASNPVLAHNPGTCRP